MAYIGWATHVRQGLAQRAATVKTAAIPQIQPQFGLRAATARMKLKSLVIVHHDVTVNFSRALHTPPITLGARAWQEARWGPPGPARRLSLGGQFERS